MSASRNPDGPGVGTEFHSKIAPDEPMQTGGHKPGKMVGNDALPESHIEVLPAGTAPPSKTFEPNTTATDNPTSTPAHGSKLVDGVLADAQSTSTSTPSNAAPGPSEETATSTAATSQQPKLNQDDAISGDNSTRPGTTGDFGVAQPATSTDPTSTSTATSAVLSESKQDSILSATDAARPGATDTVPVGVSESSASESLTANVKSTLDSLSSAAPTTTSLTSTLPTVSQAADVVKSAAASLVSGVQSLALGAGNTVAEHTSTSDTQGIKHRTTDQIHVPGEYASKTTDAEDKSAVQRGLKSAQNALPSTQEVKQTVQSAQDSLPGTEDVKSALQSAQSNIPSTEEVKSSLQSAQNNLPSTDDVKNIFPSTETVKGSLPDTESVKQSAVSVQEQSKQALRSVKQQIPGQQDPDVGTELISDQHTSVYSGTSQLSTQIPSEPTAVPSVVTDSQRLALASPEATANPEAVQEKKEVEQDLKQGVPLHHVVPQDSSSSSSPQQSSAATTTSGVGEAVAGTLAAVGAAVASAAAVAREKTHEATGTDPVAVLPESAQKAIDGKVINPKQQPLAETLGDAASSTGETIKNAASSAGETTTATASSVGESVKSTATSTGNAVVNTASSASDSAANTAASVSDSVKSTGSSAADAVTNAASTAYDSIASTASAARDTTLDTVSSTKDAVSDAASSAGENVTGAASTTRDAVTGAASATSETVKGTATSASNSITDTASTAQETAVTTASSAREQIQQSTGTDPVSVLPTSAQTAIDGEQGQSNSSDGIATTHSRDALDPETVLSTPAYQRAAESVPNTNPAHSEALDSSYPPVVEVSDLQTSSLAQQGQSFDSVATVPRVIRSDVLDSQATTGLQPGLQLSGVDPTMTEGNAPREPGLAAKTISHIGDFADESENVKKDVASSGIV